MYDPSWDIFETYVLTKGTTKIASILWNTSKKPVFTFLGKALAKYAPSLSKGRGLRVGLSNSRGRQVFRATYGNRKTHFFDIDLGKIPKIKKK